MTNGTSHLSAGRLAGMSLYWLAVNVQWGALLIALIPAEAVQLRPLDHARLLSLILGIGAVAALILPPFVGALSDRCRHPWGRRRPYMAAGTALNLVGLLLLATAARAGSVALYILAYLVVQFGSNVATAAYSGIIPDAVEPSQRGAASGWMAVMTHCGTILGALGGGILVQRGLSGWLYGVIALLLPLTLAVTAAAVPERPGSPSGEPLRPGQILRSLWLNPRRYPDFGWVWATRFLFTAGMWMVQPFIQYYLRDVIGSAQAAEDAGRVIGIALAGATVTGLLGGALSDRFGRKRVVYVANGLMAAVSLGFMVVGGMPGVYVTATLYGLAFGAYYSVDWALGCDVLPNKQDAAKDMGVWHIAMVLPQSIAPALSGLILTMGGVRVGAGAAEPHYRPGAYLVLFASASLLLALSAWLLRNVRGVR